MSNDESIQAKHGAWQSGGILLRSAMVALMLLASIPTAEARSKAGPRQVEAARAAAQQNLVEAPDATWTFAVSGDSRNCGDVVMPAVAAGAQAHDAAFYWHLGDFRWGTDIDQDMAHEEGYRGHQISVSQYLDSNWNDFIQNQLLPFGNTPVFLVIGNHELHFKTEQDYLVEFANWLNTPIIQKQRLEDNPSDYGL
ncbi:MAG TPA: hypothetical protein VGW37_19625, partial [Terriglobia bacterium]|nr:hypothetical protein [Terriglobia bacterium]